MVHCRGSPAAHGKLPYADETHVQGSSEQACFAKYERLRDLEAYLHKFFLPGLALPGEFGLLSSRSG